MNILIFAQIANNSQNIWIIKMFVKLSKILDGVFSRTEIHIKRNDSCVLYHFFHICLNLYNSS